MKKIGSLLAALIVFAASFVPFTSQAAPPCGRYTITLTAGNVGYLNGAALTINVETAYNNFDTFTASYYGCAGRFGQTQAVLRAYHWGIGCQCWVMDATYPLVLANGCESSNYTLYGSADTYCLHSYCSAAAWGQYCPCPPQ